jgi:YidC/Oxa1 family membrane protein insertase
MQKTAVDPDPTKRLQAAKKYETQSPDSAIDEYTNIARDYTNGAAKTPEEAKKFRDIAGNVLLQATEFGYNLIDSAKAEDKALSEAQRNEIQSLHFRIGDKAHAALKELLYQHGDTPAAKVAEERKYGTNKNQTLKEALESRLDDRNKHLPSYQVIAMFVNLTGAKSGFSYWFALLLIAVVVKLITLPLMLKTYKSQREMAKIQPLLKDIQDKYKDDKVTMNQKVMETYKEHNVNPLATCFPMLVQLPFLWWVYTAIRYFEFHFAHGTFLWVNPTLSAQAPQWIAANLGQFDLALTIIYAGSNFLTMRLTPPTDPQQAQTQKMMSVWMTAMMFYFFLIYKWSSAFTFYWLMTNLIGAWQSYHFIYKPNKLEAAAQSAGSVTLNVKASPDKTATEKKGIKPITSNARGGTRGSSGKNRKRR